MTTARIRAVRRAAGAFWAVPNAAALWDVLVNAFECVELLELELLQANARLANERARNLSIEPDRKRKQDKPHM